MENPIGLQLAGSLGTSQSENLSLKERVEKLEAELKVRTADLHQISWEHLVSNRKWSADLQKISNQEKQIEELEYQLSIITSERDLALDSCEKLASTVLKYEGYQTAGTVSPLVELQEEIDNKDQIIIKLQAEIETSRTRLVQVEGLLVEHDKRREMMCGELNVVVKDRDEYHAISNSLIFENEAKDKRIFELQNKNEQYQTKIHFCQTDLKYRDEDIARLNKTISEHESEPILQLIQERKQFKEDLTAKETTISLQKDEIRGLLRELDNKDMKVGLLEDRVVDLKKKKDEKVVTDSKDLSPNDLSLFHSQNNLLAKEATINLQNNCIADLRKQLSYKDQTIEELRRHVAITTMSANWKANDSEAEKKKAKDNEATIQRQNSEIEDLKRQLYDLTTLNSVKSIQRQIGYLVEQQEKNQTPQMGTLVIRLHK